MNYQTFIKKFTDKDKNLLPKDHSQRVAASLAVQVHSSGTRPRYYAPTRMGGTTEVIPENYDKKFEDVFKTRLLNRHPNESEALYNWRLSNYSPLSEDIFNRFLIGANGAIMQPNNYVISVDEKTQLYLNTYPIKEKITECLEFVLNNPKGYIAVIVELNGEADSSQKLNPEIEFIEEAKVVMKDTDSFAFEDDNFVYFLDKTVQVTFNKSTEQALETIHGFNELPVWSSDNSFTNSFVKFADELIKNFSDDGMITKQYSYPIKQVVSPQCPKCNGQKYEVTYDENDRSNPIRSICSSCGGHGTMSINPGDNYAISEEVMMKNGGVIPDYAKFITPDIGIPEYHMKRWLEFYTKCERSLRLNPLVNGVQSGDAKKEDRKDQYAFLSAISQFVFDQIRKALVYISAYNNYNNASDRYEAQNIIVVAPKQLDLMTDSDLVNELITIQSKTDDSMILSETQYAVMNKIYKDDNVQSKINDILYQIDELYGATGNALKSKLLSGVYDNRDKTIHEKGYKILLNLSIELTPEQFMKLDNSNIIKRFNLKLNDVLPQGIYSPESNSLKESVGGLTGMIEIAKAVASGLYDLDAAVSLVSDRFGVSEEEARKQLGTPSVVNTEAQLNKIDTLT